MRKKLFAALAALVLAIGALTACGTDADVVSSNLSKDAENFKIQRKIVFYDSINGKYVAVMEGRCSIEDSGGQLEATCKVGDDKYIKNFLGLSDNVTYFALQTEAATVSKDHYKVILNPSTIVPDFEVR